jgi:amidohydrolase
MAASRPDRIMDPTQVRALAAEQAGSAVELRRDLHRNPELSWEEARTTARVAAELEQAGLTPRLTPGATGLTVDVGRGAPLVAFRADLDALPIEEASGLPFASQIPGVMHACGHDAHTAIAVGIARILAGLDLPGMVRFVFQPAEEAMPGGALEMVRRGAIEGVEALLGFHVDPSLPAGCLGLRADAITGASDRLGVEFIGPGGHTSRPHQTVDVIGAAARVAAELPALLQRVTDPRHPVAVVFGRIAGGATDNVIPTRVELGGTVRLFDLELWRSLPPIVERLVQEIVAPLGAAAKVVYDRGHPPVVNDPGVIDTVRRAAAPLLGGGAIGNTEQSLGAEDFSWYLERVPGALVRLGAGSPGRETDLHSASFEMDEDAIATGIAVGTAALLALLEPARTG